MDQSKSNSPKVAVSKEGAPPASVPMPRRTFTVEFIVGIFTLIASACCAYLSVGLGDVNLFGSDRYTIYAQFDNVSGLKSGASVELAGVQVGQVVDIKLDKTMARLTLAMDKEYSIKDDDTLQVRTKGIIGDRYVKISPGGSTKEMGPESTVLDTESVVDIEDLIGKFIHNMDSTKSDS